MDASTLQSWCDRLGGAGLRSTGSEAHEATIAWLEQELLAIAGLEVRSDVYELLRWRPEPDGDLERAGALRVRTADGRAIDVPLVGAVPYALSTTQEGDLVHLPRDTPIARDNAEGRVVLRDFPAPSLTYDVLLAGALHVSDECAARAGEVYDRPAFADRPIHADLVAAGEAGAAGIVFALDLPRAQVAGFFEPHSGTHFDLPAVYVGADERELLLASAADGARAQVSVNAVVEPGTTRNVIATLPGLSPERIVIASHTDGNTWVQENGAAGVLALARWYAALPVEDRPRTLEFAFTSGHLHMSREGTHRYAEQLDAEFDQGTVALTIAIEHLGVVEVDPVPRPDGPGRELQMTGGEEMFVWPVGPSELLRAAVVEAVARHGVGPVIVVPGVGTPVDGQVPLFGSFGGVGTHFHRHLLPTTAIISCPWTLWSPSFGAAAIDVERMRRQILAVRDVVRSVEDAPLGAIAGDYLADRAARAAGKSVAPDPLHPEDLRT
ncbi:MAG: hypothetical protein F2667_02640 [Actinobacteria bacterium]|nr:hypothetical protein [Actinomycetota bacterium]